MFRVRWTPIALGSFRTCSPQVVGSSPTPVIFQVQTISADWLFISFLCNAYVRCGDEGSAIPMRSSALVWWTLATGGTAGCSPQETDFSRADVYSADGAFVTGTFAGIYQWWLWTAVRTGAVPGGAHAGSPGPVPHACGGGEAVVHDWRAGGIQ